ncbi:MAG: hypothetical protein GY698_21580 [Actinomycetia bacterium]|nr:hypothetical protein [Actinomycetes bacterium]
MADPFVIADMVAALSQRLFPTVTLWNRLEARPRTENFDQALSAEIRDPLWMLTRQVQLGEFAGDDAGSPISAQIRMDTTRFTEFQPASRPVGAFPHDAPLEATVEQLVLPFGAADQKMSLDLRLLMGRRWLRMLAKHVGDFAADYRKKYPIDAPDATDEFDAAIVAHQAAWQRVAAVAGRTMDGYEFYRHLAAGGDAVDGISVPPAQQTATRDQAARFVGWFDELFLQPTDPNDNAWLPERLEYSFSATATEDSAQRRYTGAEYYQGRLDWYSLDVETGLVAASVAAPDPRETTLKSFVPVEVAYEGMPNTRWWTFEDRKTNFGQITPNTTELGKLLFIEFALVYANDWFLLPHSLPAGSIADIGGLVVTNVFGERTWIDAAGSGDDEDWQRWAMFGNSTVGDESIAADQSLLIVPTVPKIQEGDPIEEVALVRDEQANMVWAVESSIPLPTGRSVPGREAAHQTTAFHHGLAGAASIVPTASAANISYRVMSSVDENWIPFVPVHVGSNTREVQLQRAAMPRIIEGDTRPVRKIEPRSTILRTGLDATPPETYHVHEEEVTRAGVRVTMSYQRARWYGGKTVNWLGARKWTGRGSGSSGLSFDYLDNDPT